MIGLVICLGIFIVVMNRLLPLPVFGRRAGFTFLATLVVAGTPLGWDYHKAG